MAADIESIIQRELGVTVLPVPELGTPHIYLTVFLDRVGSEDKAWAYVGKHDGGQNGKYSGSGKHLNNAIKKYGRDRFVTFCLERAEDAANTKSETEQKWLDHFLVDEDVRFFNIVRLSGGGAALAAILNSVKDENGKSVAGLKGAAKTNSVKDENGKSVAAVKGGKKVAAAVRERWQDPAFRERIAAATRENWQDQAFRERIAAATWQDPEFRKRHAAAARESWKDPEFRERQAAATRKNWQDPAFRERNAAAVRENWQDPEFRERQAAAVREKWQDPEFRERNAAATREKLWADPEFRERNAAVNRERWQDPEFRERNAAATRKGNAPGSKKSQAHKAACTLDRRVLHIESGTIFRTLGSAWTLASHLFCSDREMRRMRNTIHKSGLKGEWLTIGSRTGNTFRLLVEPRAALKVA